MVERRTVIEIKSIARCKFHYRFNKNEKSPLTVAAQLKLVTFSRNLKSTSRLNIPVARAKYTRASDGALINRSRIFFYLHEY